MSIIRFRLMEPLNRGGSALAEMIKVEDGPRVNARVVRIVDAMSIVLDTASAGAMGTASPILLGDISGDGSTASTPPYEPIIIGL